MKDTVTTIFSIIAGSIVAVIMIGFLLSVISMYFTVVVFIVLLAIFIYLLQEHGVLVVGIALALLIFHKLLS